MRIFQLLSAAALMALLGACDAQTSKDEGHEKAAHTDQAAITAEQISQHVKILSSDAFGGRAPGTEGAKKTIAYISDRYKELGLAPANGDSYVQPVAMAELTAKNVSPLSVRGGQSASLDFVYQNDMMVWTKRVADKIAVKDSDIVFVGYGVNAPEYGWNDYEGLDVKGKTVLILVNDPGFATKDPEMFNGKAMTYYGRWTYKYEEAARQGAAAALIIHETEPAAYPWSVVQSSWSGPQLDLKREDGNMNRVSVEGWVTQDAAKKILAAAGQDLDALKHAALKKDFKAVDLGLKASVSFENDIRFSDSYNVAGLVKGSKHPDETVIYMAHWDHLGHGPAVGGDDIYNGAVDNATGIAALLELAEQYAKGPAPERSVMFLAVTGEESGLLGSAYYAEHPLVPLAKTVADINMDAMNVIGEMRDIIVVGYGKSELEDILKRHAEKAGRVVVPEDSPETGSFYRSDHFNLAKAGVPSLYTETGIDSVEHGKEWARAQFKNFTANHYHQPSDEFDPNWDLKGMVADVRLLYEVGYDLATSRDWPNWRPDAEFRAAREAQRQK